MELAGRNPGYRSITVSDSTATVSSGSLGNRRASDRYTFDRVTGEITGSSLYRDSDRNSRIRGWIYSVHVGSWGGIVTRILAFLSALVGASLPSYRLLHVDTAAPASPPGMTAESCVTQKIPF